MPAAVVFILFVICLIIAIPVSIALAIASVLPGAFDPSFTASATVCDPFHAGRTGQLSVPCGSDVRACPESSWREAASPKNYSMCLPTFWETVTAGLPCAVIVTCLFYGAISGSGPATVAAVGSMTIPILASSLGYDQEICRGES